jgi:hypothetical protein
MQIDIFQKDIHDEKVAHQFMRILKRIGRNSQFVQAAVYSDREYPNYSLTLVLTGLQDVEKISMGILSHLNEVVSKRLKMPLNEMSSFYRTSLVLSPGLESNSDVIIGRLKDLYISIKDMQRCWMGVDVEETLFHNVMDGIQEMREKTLEIYNGFQNREG